MLSLLLAVPYGTYTLIDRITLNSAAMARPDGRGIMLISWSSLLTIIDVSCTIVPILRCVTSREYSSFRDWLLPVRKECCVGVRNLPAFPLSCLLLDHWHWERLFSLLTSFSASWWGCGCRNVRYNFPTLSATRRVVLHVRSTGCSPDFSIRIFWIVFRSHLSSRGFYVWLCCSCFYVVV
jgi:hypothetical protein